MQKLRIEIDEVVSDAEPNWSGRVPNSTIKQMPYLQACISESLRLYPPVFLQLRERVVPPGGVILNGYTIPGGTYVGFNSIGTQLNSVYGPDVEEFRPERWMIEDQVRLREMRRTLDLVFGHSNSKCLGINIANMEINLIIFEACFT